jgi:2',3'-cyclic-nucleotide 2'-phosphodiesterase (5'-nucleotidase family)
MSTGKHRQAYVLQRVALALALLLLPALAWCSPEYRALTILYTNDTHDHLLPFSYPDPPNSKVQYAGMAVIKDIGGIARRGTLARQIESQAGNVLLVDAGDCVDGTPFSLEYKGEADFAAMGAAGYDVMTLGNHEFGVTLSELHRNFRAAGFPIVCANLIDRKTGELLLPPYRIYDFRGARIAVFGVTVPSPEYKAAVEGLDFKDPYETAKRLVPELKKQADIIVALSHLGWGEDERLAKEVPEIDVIVGGHSHTRAVVPKLVRHGEAPHAFWIGGTIIVQAFEKGAELGRLDLRLRRNGGLFTLMSYKGELLPITSKLADDPQTAKVVDRYYRPISKRYSEVIGEATETLYDDRSGESSVLNLVCDAIRETTGAEIAVYGIGGIRADILKGPIRVWDIATVLPFTNKLVVMDLTGAQIKQIINRFPIKPGVSGMRYRTVGGRVTEATIGGKPIEDDQVYSVGTIDWLVGLYFGDVADSKTLDVYSTDAVVDYVRAKKIISPVKDSRKDAQ